MPWIVKVDVDGHCKWLAKSQQLPHNYAHVEDREKANRFNSETDANETASFRGCRRWKTERVE